MMIVGIDEVGRGCWAGPLVAAAVILMQPIFGLTDSKLLDRRKRKKFETDILLSSIYGLGWVWPEEIDILGLTAATTQAMSQALSQIKVSYDEIIIDGNFNYLNVKGSTSHISRVKTLVGADRLVPAVSAASILAKVARDEYMCAQALKCPGYGFEKHVGYGTKQHAEALKHLGPCDLHRLSFKPIKALLV